MYKVRHVQGKCFVKLQPPGDQVKSRQEWPPLADVKELDAVEVQRLEVLAHVLAQLARRPVAVPLLVRLI